MRTLARTLALGFILAATSAGAQTTLQVAEATVTPGVPVTATWSGIANPTSTDWIGIYVPGAANTARLSWRYTTGAASGSVPVFTPTWIAPGTYELRLFSNGGYTLLATSNTFAVPQTTLQVAEEGVNAGGSVTATWSGIGSPTVNDWIGMYVPGVPNTAPVATRKTTGAASGSVPFTVPSGVATGTYHLRLFRWTGFGTLLATSNTFYVNPAVVSGTVSAGGSPLAGVAFSATGGDCTASDASGQYSCSMPPNWSGTVTPSLAGYSFTPVSRSYSNAAGSVTGQDYTALATTLSAGPTSVNAGGTVTATWTDTSVATATDWIGMYVSGSSDQAHVSWQYTGGASSGSLPFNVPISATAGNYELRLFSNNGYLRLATSNSFTVSSAAISGTVNLSGSPLPGVALAAGTGTSCSSTNASGQYTCTVPSGWSGTVVPTLSGYSFTPASRAYSNVVSDQTGQDYAAAAAQSSAAQLHFVHTDHLNTPRLVADATGTTVWRWDQVEPFGNNPADEDPDGNAIAFDLPLRLPGQRYDAETVLHYNYFRDYDPSLGRYGESDPIGLRGGLNTYAYGDGTPIVLADPYGLQASSCAPQNSCKPACEQSYFDCLANCIRANDPTVTLFGDSSTAVKGGMTALGGTFPKSWAGLPKGLGGASPVTTVPSAATHAVGGGASGTVGGIVRSVGRFCSPIWIGYGLGMATVEVICATGCAQDSCLY